MKRGDKAQGLAAACSHGYWRPVPAVLQHGPGIPPAGAGQRYCLLPGCGAGGVGSELPTPRATPGEDRHGRSTLPQSLRMEPSPHPLSCSCGPSRRGRKRTLRLSHCLVRLSELFSSSPSFPRLGLTLEKIPLGVFQFNLPLTALVTMFPSTQSRLLVSLTHWQSRRLAVWQFLLFWTGSKKNNSLSDPPTEGVRKSLRSLPEVGTARAL